MKFLRISLAFIFSIAFLYCSKEQEQYWPSFLDKNKYHPGLKIIGEKVSIDPKYFLLGKEQYYRTQKSSEGLLGIEIDGRWGCIDIDGQLQITPRWHYIHPFKDGTAIVESKFRYKGLIDRSGKYVLPVEYLTLDYAENGKIRACSDKVCSYFNKDGKSAWGPIEADFLAPFKEGLAFFRAKHKFGFVNEAGKVIIQPQFDGAQSFSEGLAAVMIVNKWGFADREGHIVIKFHYSDVSDFMNGKALVSLEGRSMLIDRKGRILKYVKHSPDQR